MQSTILVIAFNVVIAVRDALLRKRNIPYGELLLALAKYLMYNFTSRAMLVFLVLVLYVIIAATDSIRVRINVMGISTISIVRIISLGWRV
jgi:hypothetical protein